MMAANTQSLIWQVLDGKLAVTVFDSIEGTGLTREEWDGFVLAVGGDLYASYDWCRIWWRHYGTDRQLRIFVFREGSDLVGLAPMFIECIRLVTLRFKIAKRVGADFGPNLFALPLVVDYAEAAYRELISRLIDGEKCDAVWFGVMPGNDTTLSGLRGACQSLEKAVTVARDEPAGPHALFHLPDSFEAYLASLHASPRQNYRRRLKLLKKKFKVESDVIKDALQAGEAFRNFELQHTRQWKEENKLGHFADWPRAKLFNTDLINELIQLGRFRIVRLFADQIIIAMHYAFVFGNCCYDRLTSRVVGSEWDRFGLGILGQMCLNEAMINEGVHRIEAGPGHYEYKVSLGAEELQSRSVLVVSNRGWTARRVRVFLIFSDILHLIYYRIWFLRVAPLLPLPRRPLWRVWIRSRV